MKMKIRISIHTIVSLEAQSIADAIEQIAKDDDSIASGVVGPSFSTSGPGNGWTRQNNSNDYAKRALGADYGADSYIDSSDGREATMNGDEMEWAEESAVVIKLPSVEDAMAHPEEAKIIIEQALAYGADEDALSDLSGKLAAPYSISDGNATEYAATVEDAASIAEDWYDYLIHDGKLTAMPSPNLDWTDLDTLESSVARWKDEIAEALGYSPFSGHGRYYVTAASAAGLSLSITIRK